MQLTRGVIIPRDRDLSKVFLSLFPLNKASLSNKDIWSMLISCLCFKDFFFLEFETHQVEGTEQKILSHTKSQLSAPGWVTISKKREILTNLFYKDGQ